jgi:hypothetical protein
MKRLLVLLLLSPGALHAQSPFDGTWIINTDAAQLPQKPIVYLLAKGMFRCSACFANTRIKADGHDQEVTDSSYWNTVSVRTVDSYTVELIAKKAGETMFTEIDTISPDGGTLTQVVKDTTESQPVTSETVSQRVKKGPAGSHALSGSWRAYKFNRSKNGSTIKYRCTENSFSAETPLGERYDAKFDGNYYPVEDDPGHTMAAAKLLSPNTVEVTSRRNEKIVGVLRLSVAPDGGSIHAVFEDKESNTTRTYEMKKQPE